MSLTCLLRKELYLSQSFQKLFPSIAREFHLYSQFILREQYSLPILSVTDPWARYHIPSFPFIWFLRKFFSSALWLSICIPLVWSQFLFCFFLLPQFFPDFSSQFSEIFFPSFPPDVFLPVQKLRRDAQKIPASFSENSRLSWVDIIRKFQLLFCPCHAYKKQPPLLFLLLHSFTAKRNQTLIHTDQIYPVKLQSL